MKGLPLVLFGFLLSACAAPSGATPASEPTEAPVVGESPAVTPPALSLTDTVFAIGPSDGWLLAREGLFKVAERGLLRTAFEPADGWSTAAITASGAQITVALVRDGLTVEVFQSSDSGERWSELPSVEIATMNGISGLTVGVNGSAIILLADESSSNVSFGTAAISDDAGEHWRSYRPPTGGRLTSAGGEFWLVGGVIGNETYVSLNGSDWTAARPPQEGDWTAGVPWALSDERIVLPITSPGDGSSAVTLWTRAGENTWGAGPSIETVSTEAGVDVPASGGPDGTWVVVQADGGKVFAGSLTDTEPQTISPNGLPAGILQIARIGDSVVVAYGMTTSCPDGKPSCTSAAGVWYSADLGQTFAELGLAD